MQSKKLKNICQDPFLRGSEMFVTVHFQVSRYTVYNENGKALWEIRTQGTEPLESVKEG